MFLYCPLDVNLSLYDGRSEVLVTLYDHPDGLLVEEGECLGLMLNEVGSFACPVEEGVDCLREVSDASLDFLGDVPVWWCPGGWNIHLQVFLAQWFLVSTGKVGLKEDTSVKSLEGVRDVGGGEPWCWTELQAQAQEGFQVGGRGGGGGKVMECQVGWAGTCRKFVMSFNVEMAIL